MDIYDKICSDLISAKERMAQIALTKARAEIEAINRERAAYEEGVFDTIRAIKQAMQGEARP